MRACAAALLSGIAPSDYYLIALDRLETPFNDPELLERLRSQATAVSIREGESKTVDLKINKAP